MQNREQALPRLFLLQSLVTVLHTCVSIMLKCIRTRFRTEAMLKHLVPLPEYCFQFKYLEFILLISKGMGESFQKYS